VHTNNTAVGKKFCRSTEKLKDLRNNAGRWELQRIADKLKKDPQGSQRYPENGIWQDGRVFVKRTDGTLSMYLGMFLNQTINTDNNGNPVEDRQVKAIPYQ
jgi:hypothetical protein